MAASPVLQRLSTFKDGVPFTACAATMASPPDAIAGDPILSAFLSPDFSAARFSSNALSAGSAAARAEHLQDAIGLLYSQIRSEVLSRHRHLLAHLSSLSDAHSALSLLRSSLSSLWSSLLRLRLDLSDPHRSLRILSLQLSRLHAAPLLLHATVRLLRLSRKLRDLVAEGPAERLDLTKAAQLHREILAVAVVDEACLARRARRLDPGREGAGAGPGVGGVEPGRGRERIAGLRQARGVEGVRGGTGGEVQEAGGQERRIGARFEAGVAVGGVRRVRRPWERASEQDAADRRRRRGEGGAAAEVGCLYESNSFDCGGRVAFAEGVVDEARSFHPCTVP